MLVLGVSSQEPDTRRVIRTSAGSIFYLPTPWMCSAANVGAVWRLPAVWPVLFVKLLTASGWFGEYTNLRDGTASSDKNRGLPW